MVGRKHHAVTDRDGDPHSPRLQGAAHQPPGPLGGAQNFASNTAYNSRVLAWLTAGAGRP
jgi:hypothetical protein